MLAAAPAGLWGIVLFDINLTLLGTGAVLIFVNPISLRQAVTPASMLGRMMSTMRWLILIPAGPGALIGGWLGEHAGLRASLAFAGAGAVILSVVACCSPLLRTMKALPVLVETSKAPDAKPTRLRCSACPARGALSVITAAAFASTIRQGDAFMPSENSADSHHIAESVAVRFPVETHLFADCLPSVPQAFRPRQIPALPRGPGHPENPVRWGVESFSAMPGLVTCRCRNCFQDRQLPAEATRPASELAQTPGPGRPECPPLPHRPRCPADPSRRRTRAGFLQDARRVPRRLLASRPIRAEERRR